MSKCPPCIFCISNPDAGTNGIGPERIVHGYENWWLVLQPEAKREKTKQAAGMLVTKRHVEVPSMILPEEVLELHASIKDASAKLCAMVGSVYMDQETVGFNEGPEAGQTVEHAHVHILPVSESDPSELKVRGGIGGAFEALRAERIG